MAALIRFDVGATRERGVDPQHNFARARLWFRYFAHLDDAGSHQLCASHVPRNSASNRCRAAASLTGAAHVCPAHTYARGASLVTMACNSGGKVSVRTVPAMNRRNTVRGRYVRSAARHRSSSLASRLTTTTVVVGAVRQSTARMYVAAAVFRRSADAANAFRMRSASDMRPMRNSTSAMVPFAEGVGESAIG